MKNRGYGVRALWVLLLWWCAAALSWAAPVGRIGLYWSDTTERWLLSQGQSYEPTMKVWRQYLAGYRKEVQTVRHSELSGSGGTLSLLIVPNAQALDEAERIALGQLRAKGVSLLATGLTGTRGGSGEEVGFDWLHQNLHVQTQGTFESDESLFMMPYGDGPLSWTLPAGRRIDVGENTKGYVRVQARHLAAVLLDWDRIMDPQPHGLLAYDEVHGQRTAYLGLIETQLPFKRNPDMQALLDSTIAWLRRQPQAFKAAWPHGLQAAHLIEMDTEDKFASALLLADDLERFGFRGTFYSLTSEAVRNPEVVKALLRRGHEVAYHADVHFGFGKLPESEQRLRMEFMVRQMKSIVGEEVRQVTGFRAPTESYDLTTERLLRSFGIKHHAADPSASDDRVPFFSVAEKGIDPDVALVVLPRTQWDDINFTFLRIPPPRIEKILAYDLQMHLDSGALSLLSVHSQFFIPGGLMNPLMRPYLERVAAVKDKMWVARGDAITQWWRDRAQVEVVQNPLPRGSVGLEIRVRRAVSGITVMVTAAREGAQPRWVPSAATPLAHPPRVMQIDRFRSALVFPALSAGLVRGHVEFP